MGGDPEYLVVGHLSKPHGIRGEIMVWPLTDQPEELFSAGRELVLGDEQGDAGGATETCVVEASRPYRNGILLKLEGVEDRSGAEELVSRYLLVPRSERGQLEEGEFYYHQLLGLTVETVDGEAVGKVREVFETEPDHLLEVKGQGRRHLIPFTRRIVMEVDVDGGRVVIDPPEGLLEL